MPKNILFLTSQAYSQYDIETCLVADELARSGVDSTTLDWSAPEVPTVRADLAVIRSTWDYTTRLGEFLSVLGRLPMPLLNPLPVVRWNSHKGYLAELGAAGVPVVPTQLVRVGVAASLPPMAAARIIIKPAVSAGAVGVGLFDAGSAAALDHLATITAHSDALVQPFIGEVVDGERSLIHLGGVYSHAVRKTPADGEFRVQEHLGGTNRPYTAAAAELAAAEAALAVVPGGPAALLYARIDLVGSAENPLVMELELIEPQLFLPHSPGAAERLADAIIARL